MRHAFALLSGGLDSTTCLYKAAFDYRPTDHTDVEVRRMIQDRLDDDTRAHSAPISWVTAISIDYGQRHKTELEFARRTCDKLGIEHRILNIGDILKGTMLTETNISIPKVDYADLPHGISPTYVPFRNGTMLSILAAQAQLFAKQNDYRPDEDTVGIYFGAHSEDAANWAYPDCTPEFIGAMANAIYIGTYRTVRLHTPLASLTKTEIVRLGEELGVEFVDTWSCYEGGVAHCGTCPTCRSRRAAFVAAGVDDPTVYLNEVPTSDEIPF